MHPQNQAVAVSELFTGLMEMVELQVETQLGEFETNLGEQSAHSPRAAVIAQKLEWLSRKLGIYVARIPDVARLLGKFFPEIAWRVPLGRKCYQPEPRSMLYFDSVAVGVAFLESWKTKDQGEVADDENLFAGPSVA